MVDDLVIQLRQYCCAAAECQAADTKENSSQFRQRTHAASFGTGRLTQTARTIIGRTTASIGKRKSAIPTNVPAAMRRFCIPKAWERSRRIGVMITRPAAAAARPLRASLTIGTRAIPDEYHTLKASIAIAPGPRISKMPMPTNFQPPSRWLAKIAKFKKLAPGTILATAAPSKY